MLNSKTLSLSLPLLPAPKKSAPSDDQKFYKLAMEPVTIILANCHHMIETKQAVHEQTIKIVLRMYADIEKHLKYIYLKEAPRTTALKSSKEYLSATEKAAHALFLKIFPTTQKEDPMACRHILKQQAAFSKIIQNTPK